MDLTPYRAEKIKESDYGILAKKFGLSLLNPEILEKIKKHTKELHFMLRRKIFFAHRDLEWLLDEYEKGNKFFLYTGRAPSGKIHIGHLVPWIFCKWLQEKFDAELWFQFPDEEKFLFRKELSLNETEKWTYENMLDVVALGFNPKKTHFLINTKHASLLYKHACMVAKHVTFSTVRATFGFTNDSNIGSIFYTAMQAVPCFLPSILQKKNIPCFVPLGIDQDPHFRIARDVLPKIGFYKPALIHCKLVPGLKGVGTKMSASDPTSAIYTTDTPEEVREKIMKHAFSGGKETIEKHRKLGGNPEIDVSYQWLYYFFETDDRKLEEIYFSYKKGTMLTKELKEYLIEKINSFLKKHQRAREKAKKILDKFIFKE
ncbi:MAG: tryptophan--tRNA ligase [Candidatus Pacearchaeota archaeon]|nr:tryptophan--tRNA ligase [Candidatus Pacearchaeota archaeon]